MSNKLLAAAALMFSVFALITGNPNPGKKSFINPEQFADSLIARKGNLEVIDLRNKKDFNEYHIPSAINMVPGKINTSYLDKKAVVVFYSANDNFSKTAQYRVSMAGFQHTYFLKGGINGWLNRVIFPVLPEDADEKMKNEFDKIERRSMYFGGQPERKGEKKDKTYRREGC